MNGCLPVDRVGNPLHREIIHADTRSSAECREILRIAPVSRIFQLTGNRVDAHFSLPKILWIKHNVPHVYKEAAYFLNSKDFLRSRLTGITGETDFSDASLVCAMDLAAGSWAEEYIKELGLDPAKFPRIRRSSDVAGRLTDSSASVLGLPSGIPVVAGGGDAACATRGAGVRDSSTAYIYLGSSAWMSTLSEEPLLDPGMRIQNFFDLDGRRCNVCGTVQSAGSAVDWAASLVGPDAAADMVARDYSWIRRLVESVPPGARGLVFAPYLMGERSPHWDANARGTFIGFSLSHGKAELLRAVHEGVAFALKSVLDIYGEFGYRIGKLTLLGGGSMSAAWNRIFCDVIGKAVMTHPAPATATSLGAAMAAGVGVGRYSSLDVASALINCTEGLEPDPEAHRLYREIHEIFATVYERAKPIYDGLAQRRENGD
jgi:xylulokinase